MSVITGIPDKHNVYLKKMFENYINNTNIFTNILYLYDIETIAKTTEM